MSNIFAIKSRIRGVERTKKITHSMKLVSTSKLHQNQNLLKNFSRYSDNCREALELVLSGVREESPLLSVRPEIKRVCYVAFVGNRALCGSYNQDLIDELKKRMAAESSECFSVICGRWGSESTDEAELSVRCRFDDIGDVPTLAESAELSEYLKQLYLGGEADRVLLLYQRHAALSQLPECFQLLPVQARGERHGDRPCIFEPDKRTLVETLTGMYADACVRRCLLEARVSEHFAPHDRHDLRHRQRKRARPRADADPQPHAAGQDNHRDFRDSQRRQGSGPQRAVKEWRYL